MVRLRTRRWAVLLSTACLLAAGPGQAQSPEPAPEAEAPVAPAPKKRPPPRKPKPKPAEATPAPVPAPVAATPPASNPVLPSNLAPAPMPAANLPGLTVLCETRAAHYEGPKDFAVWVTRTGAIVVENPLRPLTPERTRVLQVVIAGKAATAYGPDLYALRRGGAPAALEAMLGAPVRWDAVPTALPDTLNIVSDTGQSLAQLGFRACGEAPPVKGAPIAQGRAKGSAKDSAKDSAADSGKPRVRARAASPDSGAKAPPGLHLPQGIIP